MATPSIARILLVEDEEAIRELLLEVLVDSGFGVIEADCGDAAFALLEVANMQLLLTDINMPGRLDGVALAECARANHPGLPVVFITGRSEAANRALTLSAPRAVVTKPFKLGDLLETVQQMACAVQMVGWHVQPLGITAAPEP